MRADEAIDGIFDQDLFPGQVTGTELRFAKALKIAIVGLRNFAAAGIDDDISGHAKRRLDLIDDVFAPKDDR